MAGLSNSRLALLAIVICLELSAIALICILVSGCAAGVSRVDREIRDAVVVELSRSGLRLPVSDKSLELREEEGRRKHCWGYVLSTRFRTPTSADCFDSMRDPSRGEGRSLRVMRKSVRTIIFRNDDPGPDYLMFSRPWIAGSGGRALIYVERRCPLCGFGRYYLLEHDHSGWAVAAECEAWVS